MKTKSRQTKKPKYPSLEDVPAIYAGLCAEWLPRPIRNKAADAEATAMLDALSVFEALNEDQLDYLDAVSHFVSEYEGKKATKKMPGRKLLAALLEENALTGADLSRILGGSRTLGPMILRGERSITASHARALGERFKLSPAAFL